MPLAAFRIQKTMKTMDMAQQKVSHPLLIHTTRVESRELDSVVRLMGHVQD